MREVVNSLPPAGNERLETVICGMSYCDFGYKANICSNDTYRFEYVVSGGGCIQVRKEKFRVETCDVFVIRPDETGLFRGYEDENWTRIWVCVKGGLIDALMSLYDVSGHHLFKNCRVFSMFDEIVKNAKSYEERNDIEQKNALLLHEIIQSMSQCDKSESNNSECADIVHDYIDLNYTRPISNDELADLINKSESQMIRLFKKRFQKTPYDYALERKIHAATLMLKNTHMSVRDISMTLGFRNEHYFSSCFKEKTGVTPLKCRKNIGL